MSEPRTIGGRYEVGDSIGQGGMGSVYRGTDTRTGEIVAIKALKPDIVAQDPGMVERFAREGEALRKLNHPSIVKVFGALEENGDHYLIMEYVSSGSLRDLLDKQESLSIATVLDIALDLADALTRAHRLKIIHRDIKPANVLLAEDGTPRLTDFGVARMGDHTRMTTTGAMVGTLAYLSPEACYGLEIDARSDIWAFGIMLYEMLTGHRPFEADNTAALLTGIISLEPETVINLRPDTPPALSELISRMLVKDREQRIASIRQVGAAIEAISSGADTTSLEKEWTPSSKTSDESRFDTPTPTTAETEHLPSASIPTSTVLKVEKTRKATPQIVKDETGKEFIVVPRRTTFLGKAVMAVILLVLIGLIVVLVSNQTPSESASTTMETVAPVEKGQFMVLVAQLAHRGGAERDVQNLIMQDLNQRLVDDIPFSNLRIRAYPGVISSNQHAIQVAEANAAAIVVWGSYDDTGSELELQMGDLSLFKYNLFDRAIIEKLTNVRVRMSDERRESIAFPIVGILQALLSFDGDGYGVARNSTIGALLDLDSRAEIVGNSQAARWIRMVNLFVKDTAASLDEVNAAIDLDSSNPMLYLARSLILQNLGNFDAALEDARTAQRLGPKNWATPIWQFGNDAFYLRNDFDAALPYYQQILDQRPDDPAVYTVRAAIYYLQGQYDQAKADAQRSIDLGADMNFPYLFAISIALREGRFADAQTMLQIVLEKFPDPTSGERILSAAYGGSASGNIIPSMVSAFGNFTLQQWSRVIEDVDTTLATGTEFGELYLLKGLAHCNQRDYADAEAVYSRGIEVDPEFWTLYALRAEVRQKQGNLMGALADTSVVSQSELASAFTPLMPAFVSGELSCENLFSVDFASLVGEATAGATTAP